MIIDTNKIKKTCVAKLSIVYKCDTDCWFLQNRIQTLPKSIVHCKLSENFFYFIENKSNTYFAKLSLVCKCDPAFWFKQNLIQALSSYFVPCKLNAILFFDSNKSNTGVDKLSLVYNFDYCFCSNNQI